MSSQRSREEARGIGTNLLTLLAQGSLPALHVQLARLLGAGRYGLYTWAAALVDMLSVVTLLGMDTVVTRKVSVACQGGDAQAAARATGGALRVVVVSGVLVASAIALAAPAIARWQGKPGLVVPLRMLALMPIAYHAASMFLVATQAKMVMRWDFWTRGVVQPLVLLALSTILLRVGMGLPGACLAITLGMVLTAVVAAIFYARELPLGATLRAALRQPVDAALIRMGLPLVLTALMWALQGRLDTFVLGRYRTSEEVGAYGACVLYVVSLSQVRGVFYPLVAATIPPALARGDTIGLTRFLQRQVRWVAILAMPLAVLFAGFGDGLLALFGRDFAERGTSALALLTVGHLAAALALPAFALTLSGNARYSAVAAGVCIVAQAVLLPILVPRYGAAGAAASASAGLLVSQAVQLGFAWTVLRVHGFSWGLAKVGVAALAGFALGRVAFDALPAGLAPRFFAGVSAAAVVYLAALTLLGLHDEERALVRAVAVRLRLRPQQVE